LGAHECAKKGKVAESLCPLHKLPSSVGAVSVLDGLLIEEAERVGLSYRLGIPVWDELVSGAVNDIDYTTMGGGWCRIHFRTTIQ